MLESKTRKSFDSLKTMGFTPQNHHVGMLEALCDCQVGQNTKEGAKTIVKVCQWCKRLSSGPLTGHDVLQTACEKKKVFMSSEDEEVAQPLCMEVLCVGLRCAQTEREILHSRCAFLY